MKEESLFFLILRLLIGIVFIVHGLNKIKSPDNWNDFLMSKKSTFGYSFSLFIAYCETIIGIFLVLGLFTRITAIIGIIFMCAAIYIAHINEPINTYSYQISLVLILICISIYGGGDYSIDYLLKN